MHLAARLFVAGVVVFAPTVLFLGLVRGVERLRDDRLVDRLRERVDDAERRTSTRPTSVLTGDVSRSVERAECPACGRPNPAYADFCAHCLEPLDGDASREA